MKKTLYELVGVPKSASREVIAAACQRRIAKFEAEGTDDARAQVFALREAWAVLGEAKQRDAYDASLANPAPSALLDRTEAKFAAQLAPETVAETLLKRREEPRTFGRLRQIIGLAAIAIVFSTVAAWNYGNRTAQQKRLEAATYEAEYGEAMPDARKAAKAEPAKAAEPFSADKFEQELKAREAEIQQQVAADQTAQEDEFRNKNQQENRTSSGRRRYRDR